MRRYTLFCFIILHFASLGRERQGPGPLEEGFLLPNGWTVTPAGEQVAVGDLPLALRLTGDGRWLLVNNNGWSPPSVTVVDTQGRRVVGSVPVDNAWLGLLLSADGKTLYVSGGGENRIYRFRREEATLEPMPPLVLAGIRGKVFPAGLALDPSGRYLYVAANLAHAVWVYDLARRRIAGKISVGKHPYACLASPDGTRLYVSNWGGASVSVIDLRRGRVTATVATGQHPNDLVLSPDARRLFVANGNENTVSVVDTGNLAVTETIFVALYARSPAGATPNGLAVDSRGRRLYVANATNNNVAVVDISVPGESKVMGFIPTGWYPTAVALSPDDGTLYVANGKGVQSFPNAQDPPGPTRRDRSSQHIGSLLKGTVSILQVPDDPQLARFTSQVYKNSPFRGQVEAPAPEEEDHPVPHRPGQTSPIQHVLYILKENRTYDQVLGDLPEGNGDPNLVLFGEEVTPNHHALAREFVLLDNFYADAEVSADGHNWSTAAYATDYVEKLWPTTYAGRHREYDYEGENPTSYPKEGFLWDLCARHGISYRSYGEFTVDADRPGEPSRATMPSLEGHIDPFYRGFDLDYSDLDRAKEFLREFREFEKNGNLPRFMILWLPNDHTAGTRPGKLTPRAYVAENDLALGMIVEAVSQSRYWNRMAVFVVEDDAQNGPDHVDAHRTVALVISPYARRKSVDSTLYSTSSMIRTMELILGLPPMTQFDAAATPMYRSFTSRPDFAPYRLRPARVDLKEVNPPDAPGAQRSLALNLEREDAIPDLEFSRIIWKSVRGPDSEMPAPVRSYFGTARKGQGSSE
ncbi:MAG: bifunctional YncE family protein/alkaline phosphatase family protein [Acidobacteria bacterium]|nr:bifunctional YncE family protein/alkaline phosphatase family protein [Acidobacteriota bacterium]